MLTERFEHFVTIFPDRQLRVRTDRIIEDDGVELARTHHSEVRQPDEDIEKLAVPLVKDVATLLWTDAVVKTYTETKTAKEAAALGIEQTVSSK